MEKLDFGSLFLRKFLIFIFAKCKLYHGIHEMQMISINYGSRLVRLDLILTMRDIHIKSNLKLLAKLTSSSRSTKFKDTLETETRT